MDITSFLLGYESGKTAASGDEGHPNLRYVTFMSHDGLVELGKKAVAVGDNCADPIERGIFSTPTRESDAQYNYSFVGWATEPNGAWDETALNEVTQDRTVYAAYAKAVRYYTITYLDTDGSVMETESLAYGTVPTYKPTHESYVFASWNPEPVAVTGDASYTVVWSEKPSFADSPWAKIAEVAESGNAAEYFSVGDERIVPVTISGTTYDFKAKIVGFNHDELEDGSKAGISCMFFTAEPTGRSFGATLASGLLYTSGTPYVVAKNYGHSTYFLPEDMRAVLKAVKKEHNPALSTEKQVQYLKTWIPSLTEVGVTRNLYLQSITLGTRYEMFQNGAYGSTNTPTDPLAVYSTSGSNIGNFWARGMSTVADGNQTKGGPTTFSRYSYSDKSSQAGVSNATSLATYLAVGFCI